MAPEDKAPQSPQQINRVFEQPPDAITCYADMAQVLNSGQEIVMQFYETVPGVPGPGGRIQMVRTRLRATVILNPTHAKNLGEILLKQLGQPSQLGG